MEHTEQCVKAQEEFRRYEAEYLTNGDSIPPELECLCLEQEDDEREHFVIRHKPGKISIRQRRDRLTEAKRIENDRDASQKKKNHCLRKKKMTESVARITAARNIATRGHLQAYHCQYGNHWHVGSVKRKTPHGVLVR